MTWSHARYCRQAAVLLLAAVLLSGCSLARQAMYAPRADAIDIRQWNSSVLPEEVHVTTTDHLRLQGFYWPGAKDDPDTIIFFHGRGAHQGVAAKYAQYLIGRGDSVLVASYRGFGGNPGLPTRTGMLRDAAAFVAEAQRRKGGTARLWFVGHSLGGAVALAAAENYGKPAGVFTISTFDQFSQAAPKIVRALLPDAWDNAAAARRLDVPIVLLHGNKDDVVPFSSMARILRAASGPTLAITMREATHKPNMPVIGSFLTAEIDRINRAEDPLTPPMPAGWEILGAHPEHLTLGKPVAAQVTAAP